MVYSQEASIDRLYKLTALYSGEIYYSAVFREQCQIQKVYQEKKLPSHLVFVIHIFFSPFQF